MATTVKKFLRNNVLTISTIFGVLSGGIVGIIIRNLSKDKWTEREAMYIEFIGQLFLRMLKLLIIPLLMSSIISAVGGLDLSLSKRIAFRSIAYYATTTVCAVILGIILVLAIRPGIGGQAETSLGTEGILKRRVLTQDTILDLIRNLFPPNLVQACIAQSQTTLIEPKNSTFDASVDINSTVLATWAFKEKYEDGTNVLGLVVFSIAFGISIGLMGQKGKPLVQFFELLSEAMMHITSWVIWISPIGVFFLVAAKMVNTKDFGDLIGRLGIYFATVLLGLVLHGFGTIPLIYFIATRRLPFKLIAKLSQVMATAFGTASRDRFRTTINVMCDCVGARLVDVLSIGELDKVEEIDRLNADPQELVEITKDTRHN